MTAQGKKPAVVALALAAIAAVIAVAVLNRGNQNDQGSDTSGDEPLVVGFENAPRSSDPRLIGFDANSQYLEELRFLPLFSFGPDGSLRPLVAESVEAKSDLEFVVKLRTGLKFSNGDSITPHDVVATYKHMAYPEGGFPPSPRKGAFARLKSVVKSGPSQVTFKLREPDAAFPTNLVIGVLPEKAMAEAPEEINGKGYESGPYVLVDRTDSQWIVARNDSFNGTSLGIPKPQIRRVKFQIIKDATTRYAALVRGDIDILQNGLDSDKLVSVQAANEFNLLSQTRMSVDYLGFNTTRKPFNNPLVRRAIAHGINRDEILKFTLQGFATKASGMFPDEFPWKKPREALEHDPEKAKSLLDEAGFTQKGSAPRLSFNIKVTTSKTRIALAKAIAAQLKEIGIAVEVESLEFGVFMDQLKEGAVPTWLASWTGFKDPDHLHFVFHSEMAPPNGANRGRYSNPKLDELLTLGKSETDPEKRKQHYSAAQDILAEELPYVYLWHSKNVAVVKKNVKGFKLYSDGRYSSLPNVTRE